MQLRSESQAWECDGLAVRSAWTISQKHQRL